MTARAADRRRRWASLPSASKYADCSAKTLRRYISAGELPAYYVGKRRSIRVDLNDIDDMIRPIPAAASVGRSA